MAPEETTAAEQSVQSARPEVGKRGEILQPSIERSSMVPATSSEELLALGGFHRGILRLGNSADVLPIVPVRQGEHVESIAVLRVMDVGLDYSRNIPRTPAAEARSDRDV